MIEPVWEFEKHGMVARGVMHSCAIPRCPQMMDFVGAPAGYDECWVAFGQSNNLLLPEVLEAELTEEDAATNARLGAILGVEWRHLTPEGMHEQLAVTLALAPAMVDEIEAQSPEELLVLRRLTTVTARGRDGVLWALRALRSQRTRATCEGPVGEWLA